MESQAPKRGKRGPAPTGQGYDVAFYMRKEEAQAFEAYIASQPELAEKPKGTVAKTVLADFLREKGFLKP